MAVVGADCVYLSDECGSQEDVLSLWSDSWSVGDPVNLPDLSDSEDCKNILWADAMVQSTTGTESFGDNGDWLSDLLQSACPNNIASSSAERLASPVCDPSVLSPTDSGHHSISSSTAAVEFVIADQDAKTDAILESCDETTIDSVILKELNNNNSDDHVADLAAMSQDVPVCCSPQECDYDMSSFELMEYKGDVMSERPKRVAARRAEIAFVREDSECDDSDEGDDDAGKVSRYFQSRHQSRTAEITSSRRGRSRATEFNKNALNARINRQKKKAYIASLEAQKAHLLSANKRLRSDLLSLVSQRDDLMNEVAYLKSVLTNDSVLAKLVQSINGPPLKLSSRFNSTAEKWRRVKSLESDHNYGPAPTSKLSGVKPAAGICLHVTENQLSMELCHRCARMACGDGSDNSFDP